MYVKRSMKQRRDLHELPHTEVVQKNMATRFASESPNTLRGLLNWPDESQCTFLCTFYL